METPGSSRCQNVACLLRKGKAQALGGTGLGKAVWAASNRSEEWGRAWSQDATVGPGASMDLSFLPSAGFGACFGPVFPCYSSTSLLWNGNGYLFILQGWGDTGIFKYWFEGVWGLLKLNWLHFTLRDGHEPTGTSGGMFQWIWNVPIASCMFKYLHLVPSCSAVFLRLQTLWEVEPRGRKLNSPSGRNLDSYAWPCFLSCLCLVGPFLLWLLLQSVPFYHGILVPSDHLLEWVLPPLSGIWFWRWKRWLLCHCKHTPRCAHCPRQAPSSCQPEGHLHVTVGINSRLVSITSSKVYFLFFSLSVLDELFSTQHEKNFS